MRPMRCMWSVSMYCWFYCQYNSHTLILSPTRGFIITSSTATGMEATQWCNRHTHTCLTALCPGLPGWAGTRKVKPIWILLKQETVSGSGISWAICKSAPSYRQITTPAPYHSVFYRPDALPVAQPTVSKHWRQIDVDSMQITTSAAVLAGLVICVFSSDTRCDWIVVKFTILLQYRMFVSRYVKELLKMPEFSLCWGHCWRGRLQLSLPLAWLAFHLPFPPPTDNQSIMHF